MFKSIAKHFVLILALLGMTLQTGGVNAQTTCLCATRNLASCCCSKDQCCQPETVEKCCASEDDQCCGDDHGCQQCQCCVDELPAPFAPTDKEVKLPEFQFVAEFESTHSNLYQSQPATVLDYSLKVRPPDQALLCVWLN